MRHSAARCLAVLSLLLLQACGGGGSDDTATPPPGGQNLTAAEMADYQLYLRTDVGGYGCALNAYYRDCETYYNGLNYFNGKCAQGDAAGCQYSQALQANYMTYALSRRY